MSRVGFWLNLLFIVIVTAPAYGMLGAAFQVDLRAAPFWATG